MCVPGSESSIVVRWGNAGERGTLPTVHSLQIAPVTGSGGEPYRERDREPVVE